MRTRRLIIPVIALALVYGACGSDEESDPDLPLAASGEAPTLAFELPAPAHGGTVVPVGQQAVEVVPREDGTVQAYVVTPEPPPRDHTQLTIRVPGSDGRPHPVVLTWDPRSEAYAGRLRQVQPVAGPIEVIMVVEGQRYAGRAPHVVLIAPSAPTVVVEAPRAPEPEVHVVEPERPTVVVEAPARPTIVVERPHPPTIVVERPHPPTIVVERPHPTIVVERPHPTVVVHAPGPPHVRVHHDHGRHRGHGRHGRGRVRFRH